MNAIRVVVALLFGLSVILFVWALIALTWTGDSYYIKLAISSGIINLFSCISARAIGGEIK